MSNPFENIIDNQKKMFDYWTDLSKKTMSSWSNTAPKTDNPADLLKEYYDRQKAFFEDLAKISDPKEAFMKSPDNFKKWMDVQTEFADRWQKLYKDSASQFGVKMPEWTPGDTTKGFESGMKDWQSWVKQSNDWIRENLLAKMPAPMQEHYKSFSASYSDLHKYWESFSKMIQFGITHKEVIDKYFSPEAYKIFVDKFMGFRALGNVDELLDNANKFFDEYTSALSKYAPSGADMSEQWKKMLNNFASSDLSPMFKTILDLNDNLHHEISPYLSVMGEGKEMKMVKILKDIQFAYVAYILKTADMQTKVYQAGTLALPQVMKEYYEDYKVSNEMPDYKTFYNKYINELENCITEVLKSDEYSVMQSDVAKTGITVKAKYEDLIELMFSDMPFLMKSQGDDIALENATLRKKLRALEERVSELETSKVDALVIKEDKIPKAIKPQTALIAEIKAEAGADKKKDDLKRIEGIGPKIEEILHGAGIKTFLELSKANAEYIKSLLNAAGPRFKMHDPASWMQQALLAANNEWEALQKWQDELKGGKAAE